MPDRFKLTTDMTPKGDQPAAIEALVRGLADKRKHQVLLGVTGSGKTFTMANVIAQVNRPVLVISHNKTLAAQLYAEFRDFFQASAVEYFVSYYDYYQPEAYIPQKDIYIEKDASINEDLDRLRLRATSSLMARRDVIIVASVSYIYGLGAPEDWQEMMLDLAVGSTVDRDQVLMRLVKIQYNRNDVDFKRGTFRVRGDVLEIYPAYEEFAYRVELFGDTVDSITAVDPLTGEELSRRQAVTIWPAKHFVLPQERIDAALAGIEQELVERLAEFRSQGKLLEAQRLEARTRYDMEMMAEIGYCAGIENYSRHLSGRLPGQRPYTLIDYFPEDYLLVIDESHVSVPQVRGMFAGDRSRKEVLVEHGFRLPSALDNRPLRFEEFETLMGQTVFVSATPGPWELDKTGGEIVEQIIRPTGLVDPYIRIESARTQVQHLIGEIRKRVAAGERVLVTTLTKRLAEELSAYIQSEGLKGAYLHSELDAIERVQVLKDLRLGNFDVVVGVNLLREGLDLPEVSLVAILDADREGFLRSETSLIQTIGRAARNVNAEVILYADQSTQSIRKAVDETNRRRNIQLAYNAEHGITPETVKKAIRDGIESEVAAHKEVHEIIHREVTDFEKAEYVRQLEEDMLTAADNLDFEEAARIRDLILEIQGRTGGSQQMLQTVLESKAKKKRKGRR